MPGYRPDPDVVSQTMDDDCVLVHLRSNGVFVLNPTGSRFWQLLSQGKSQSEIRELLLAEFDVAEAQLDQEIEGLLGKLVELEIVVSA